MFFIFRNLLWKFSDVVGVLRNMDFIEWDFLTKNDMIEVLNWGICFFLERKEEL